MSIDTVALHSVFEAYAQTDREDITNTWLKRFVSSYHKRTSDIDLTALATDDLKPVLTPFLSSDSAYGGRVARQLPGLSVPGWRTFCEATFDAPERGAAVLSVLFDESRDLDRRLHRFDTYYEDRLDRAGTRLRNGRTSFSPAVRLGIPTGLLMMVYPGTHVIYKYREFRSFFEVYTDSAVTTAQSTDVIDQYVRLDSDCRQLRDALCEYDNECTMLDVRNVIWTHETLCELETNACADERACDDTEAHRQSNETNSNDTRKPQRATEIADQLETVGQVILYGPSGTGKTWTAMRFAEWWTRQDGMVETVTFHPSFTYEDFVEGLTATVGDDGSVGYDYRAGVFVDFVEQARAAYVSTPRHEIPPRYVLVVDEINRGNVASVFGELITCLERTHRTDRNDVSVRLAHSKTPFSVPPNVYLVGTMNTADRSLAHIDSAFRRRFRFLSFPPDFDLVCEQQGFGNRRRLRAAAGDGCLFARSILALESINETLRADGNRGTQIGHTYLLTATDADDIVDVWRYELLSLLCESHFTSLDRLRTTVFDGGGDRLFDWKRERIRPFDADDLIAALDNVIDGI